jgi:enoyl-CoA hydratase
VAALAAAVADLGAQRCLRALVITGEGRSFCAGAQLRELLARDAEANLRWNRTLNNALDALAALPFPTIAAINGYALGGGLELALACALRTASAEAVVGLPEVKLGILPGAGGTQRLPRLIGRGAALRLMLTGQLVPASDALRLGIIDEVFAGDELLDRTLELAQKIGANAPLAASAILDSVRVGLELPLDRAIRYTEDHLGRLFLTSDYQEGIAAFLDKRTPDFQSQ